MLARIRSTAVPFLLLLSMAICSVRSVVAEIPDQLSDPDGKPAAADKPVKVFILLGRSNMLGFGRIDPEDKNGTLSWLVKDQKKYPIGITRLNQGK